MFVGIFHLKIQTQQICIKKYWEEIFKFLNLYQRMQQILWNKFYAQILKNVIRLMKLEDIDGLIKCPLQVRWSRDWSLEWIAFQLTRKFFHCWKKNIALEKIMRRNVFWIINIIMWLLLITCYIRSMKDLACYLKRMN